MSLRSGTAGPAFAFRREARGLWAEVMEGQAPCRGPRGDTGPDRPPTRFRALSVLFTLFHHPEPPSGAEVAQGAAWGKPLCPRCLLGLFLPEESFPHPFPLESLVVSLEVGKKLRRLRSALWLFSVPKV